MNIYEQVQLENIADTDYEIFALLKQRYSPRVFDDKELSEDHRRELFEAVRWSASSNNEQPWRFVYANKGTEAYGKIVECLSDFNKKWATNAPFLMLTAYKEKMNENENFHALHDLGMGLGSMAMQAQYRGIALHHMAGVDWQKAQEMFQVPEGYHITSAVAVGYYGGELSSLPEDLIELEVGSRNRMPQQDFAYEGSWK